MKVFIRRAGLFVALLVPAILFLGCKSQSAKVSNPPQVVNQVAAPVAVDSADVSPEPVWETNLTPAAPEPVVIELSEGVAEVGKLAQSGMGEKVVLAFIQSYPSSFNLTAPEIVYLADLGISEDAISAMIKHSSGTEVVRETAPEYIEQTDENVSVVSEVAGQGAAPGISMVSEDSEEAVATPESVPPPVSITAAPEFTPGVQSVVASNEDTQAPGEKAQFYSALEPYGSWIDVPNYGLCWQPTAVMVNPYWQPYFDNGSWVYSSAGWYWHSNYTWGWAPFHYGRWHRHPSRGWLWAPGSTWGPAWVTWRYSNSYVGWAPLPFGAHYHDGFGLRYRTGSVGIGFDFGLSYAHYSFVPHHHFYGASPWRHRLSHNRARDIYHGTTIVNNYSQARDRSIIHHGPSRQLGASFSQPGARNVTIRDVPKRNSRSAPPNRLQRSGSDFVVNSQRLQSRGSSSRIANRRDALQATSSSPNARSAGATSLGENSSRRNGASVPSKTSLSNRAGSRSYSTISRRSSQSTSQNQSLSRTSPASGRTSVAPLQRRERQSPTFDSRTIGTPRNSISSRSTPSSSSGAESASSSRVKILRSYSDPASRSRTDTSRFGVPARRSNTIRTPAMRQEITRPPAVSSSSSRQIHYPPSRSTNVRSQPSRSLPSTRRSSPQSSRSSAASSRSRPSPSSVRTSPARRTPSASQAPRSRSSSSTSRPSSSVPSRSSGSSSRRQSTRR